MEDEEDEKGKKGKAPCASCKTDFLRTVLCFWTSISQKGKGKD